MGSMGSMGSTIPMTFGQKRKMFSLGLSSLALWSFPFSLATTPWPFMEVSGVSLLVVSSDAASSAA